MLVLAGTTCCSTTAFTPETLLTKNNNRLSQVRLDNSVYNYNNDATATTTTTPATTTAPLLSLAVQQQKDQRSLPSLVLQVETLQIRVVEEGETSSSSSTLPPILQDMANERKNFQMNLGKAMDTLRKDMPEILKTAPDYSIYHENISVVDPSGVQLTGIDNYKNSIKFMHQFLNFWFQSERSGIQYRLVYDFARSSIKVSWHAVLIPKMPLGKPLHVDGISMYKLDPDSGKIIEHKFENMSINNTPVVPPYGVFSLLQQEWGLVGTPGNMIPAGF